MPKPPVKSKSPKSKPMGRSKPSKDGVKSNPFGTKKSPGLKGFKRKKKFEEHLDLKFTDKELGEIDRIKRKLAEIRDYKRILAEDGLKPDLEDKARESELIVRLLRIEKNAKMLARQKAKFAKEKKKARQERFED